MKDLDKIAMWLQEIATEMKKDRLYRMLKNVRNGDNVREADTYRCSLQDGWLEAVFNSEFYNECAEYWENAYSGTVDRELEAMKEYINKQSED